MIWENFHRWGQYCEADPRHWADLGLSCLWEVQDESGQDGGYWISDFRNTAQVRPLNFHSDVEATTSGNYDVFLRVDRETCDDLFMLRCTPQEAFLSGNLQIAGEMRQVLQLNLMFSLLEDILITPENYA